MAAVRIAIACWAKPYKSEVLQDKLAQTHCDAELVKILDLPHIVAKATRQIGGRWRGPRSQCQYARADGGIGVCSGMVPPE